MVKYNYLELVDLIKQVSLMHPFVNSFFEGIYSVAGEESNIKYGAIVLTPNTHQIGKQVSTYNFNIMYVDRTTKDRDNTLEVQSVGIDVLVEILSALIDRFDMGIDESVTINVFKEQFADETAGALTTISIQVQSNISECHWLDNEVKCKTC